MRADPKLILAAVEGNATGLILPRVGPFLCLTGSDDELTLGCSEEMVMANTFLTDKDYRRHKTLLQENMLAARETTLAEDLLYLLNAYLVVADEWEDYYAAAANKEFTAAEDKAEYTHIQTEYMLPLMEQCDKMGWAYSDLTEIIPGAFETTKSERLGLFRSLRVWAEDKYGIIPF